MTTHNPIPARLAALKTTPTPKLKEHWREFFGTEPPPYNRRFLESRLAYRIQELVVRVGRKEPTGCLRRSIERCVWPACWVPRLWTLPSHSHH